MYIHSKNFISKGNYNVKDREAYNAMTVQDIRNRSMAGKKTRRQDLRQKGLRLFDY
jgi:hypothetical protein